MNIPRLAAVLSPVIVKEVSAELLDGPVLVTIEYSVVREQESTFVKATPIRPRPAS